MDVSDDMQLQAKALADPSRFRLFRHIVESPAAVGVAELTELLGFNHNAIRQHLAVLRDAGLVVEATEDRKVRGRPRKHYTVRDDALNAFRSISGSYEQLSRLLLQVVASKASPYDVGFHAANTSAEPPTDDTGSQPGDPPSAIGPLCRQLAIAGFDPETAADRVVTLRNCPFADVASEDQSIVCELHRGLINGFLARHDESLIADLQPHDPHEAGCEITVRTRSKES